MIAQPLTNAEKNRKLPWALGGDACNVVYVYLAMAGPVFLLFLDHLKLEKSQIGTLLALMPLAGILAVFIGPVASRLGLKRVFLVAWTMRKFILAGLIFAPWVVQAYGVRAGFMYVAAIIAAFALCRAIGDTTLMLWGHEFIPANRRGKYTAVQTIILMTVGVIALMIAGRFLGDQPQTGRFQILFAIAFVFGIGCVLCYMNVPGGVPLPLAPQQRPGFGAYLEPLRDKRFRRLLIAGGLVSLGWGVMVAFLPLFYRDHIGLREDQVVTLDAVYMVGQLCTCFLWGWTADRYGGKPQMVINLALLVLYPVALMLLPRESAYSNLWAWGILFSLGLVMPGWAIGFGRVLNVDLVPSDKKMIYMPVYITCNNLLVGVSPWIAGFALDRLPTFHYTAGWLYIDVYTPFFIFGGVLLGLAAIIFATIPTGGAMPVTTFATMFIQGNPVAAMQAIIAHQFAGHEHQRVMSVARLGQTNSPLSTQELVSALFDPSFNVRYEAVVSIARMRTNPRLTQAMVRILSEAPPDLRSAAAWALGRMGDRQAVPALRQALDSPYPTVRSRAARALGTFDDEASAPRILSLFHEEPDPSIAVAYAAALAAMGQEQVVSELLDFLHAAQEPDVRQEASLVIATLLGRDTQAQRLWRRMLSEPGDTLGGIMIGLSRRLVSPKVARDDAGELLETIHRCTRYLAMEHFEPGIIEVRHIIQSVRGEAFTPLAQVVFQHLDEALQTHGVQRIEYLFLAVHTLHVGMTDTAKEAPPSVSPSG